jgi:hypothetical protein
VRREGILICLRCYDRLNDAVAQHLHVVQPQDGLRTADETRTHSWTNSSVPPSEAKPGAPGSLVPSPLVSHGPEPDDLTTTERGGGPEGPEVEWLISEFAAGRLEPVSVRLPPLPPCSSPIVPRVAEFFQIVHGLRLTVLDDRPVPFACGRVADYLQVPKATAWRAINALVAARTLVPDEPLPPRGARGTATYLPGRVGA